MLLYLLLNLVFFTLECVLFNRNCLVINTVVFLHGVLGEQQIGHQNIPGILIYSFPHFF